MKNNNSTVKKDYVPNARKNSPYQRLLSWGLEKVTEEKAYQIADDLIEWAMASVDDLSFQDFYIFYGIPASTFHDLCNRFPFLRNAADEAKMRLGSKREKVMRKEGAKFLMHTQYQYHEDYARAKKENDDMRRFLAGFGQDALKRAAMEIYGNNIPTWAQGLITAAEDGTGQVQAEEVPEEPV